MAQTVNKQRLLGQLFTAFKNRNTSGDPESRPVFEQLVYAICREGTTREKADRAFRNLTERFFDWNELRVSSPREVEDALSDLPDPDVRAHRIISVLQEVFETTFSFDLEPLQKKGVKQAAKQLSRYQATSDFAVAWVSHYTLGGDTIPLDTPSLRVMHRLGLIENDNHDVETIRTSLDTFVPKARIAAFGDAISSVAEAFCHDDEPDCENCPLSGDCPSAQEAAREAVTARGGRSKPR